MTWNLIPGRVVHSGGVVVTAGARTGISSNAVGVHMESVRSFGESADIRPNKELLPFALSEEDGAEDSCLVGGVRQIAPCDFLFSALVSFSLFKSASFGVGGAVRA